MTEKIALEKEHGTALITLNDEKAYNAFDLGMMTGLAEILGSLAVDRGVAGLVITGKGKAFCSGGNLSWVRGYDPDPGRAFQLLAQKYHQSIVEIRRMPKPVVAAVNGVAAGGGFCLALACDFRVMDPNAVLRQGYTSNGLCIDGGGTFHLPKLVGLARALEIAAFDRPITAGQALEWGLATQISQPGQALQEAKALLEKCRATSPHSFGIVKRLLADSQSNSLETQLEFERIGLVDCARHPQGKEGLRAFAEKRKPDFQGL